MADNDRITPQNGGVGCGIAGWRDIEIAPLFRKASEFDNVALPEEFRDILNRR